MRMFLVGMGDIFLLLYLTTLSQMQERPASTLTVKDYRLLEQKQKDGEEKHKEREAELEKRDLELKILSSRLLEAEQAAQNESEKSKRIAQSAEQARSVIEKLKEEATTYQRAVEEGLRKNEDLKRLADEGAAAANRLREEAVATASEQEKRASEALERARAAEQRALEAEHAAEQAAKSEADARLQASITDARAKAQTAEANRLRTNAETRASEAEQRAIEETQYKIKAEEQFKIATQSARKAYERNVLPKTVNLKITTREDGLFGDTKETTELSVVAVKFRDQPTAFVPIESAGLDDPKSINSLRMSVNNNRVSRIFISSTSPHVLAIVLADTILQTAVLVRPHEEILNYLPVLIAVRNGTRMKFSDRMRDLSKDYYFFQRDRLARTQREAFLEFWASGFRGTRDFGERLLVGDQIVDLEGKFIGVVVGEDLILRVSDVPRWIPIAMDESGKLALSELSNLITKAQ
jgi:hypothetical protein